jgi:hypothetical protein
VYNLPTATTKGKQMLSTATALIQATEDSIFDEEVMGFAQAFCHNAKELDSEQFAKSIYIYSCMLASLAVDKTMKVLLTKEQVMELINSIDELEQMRDEVINTGE